MSDAKISVENQEKMNSLMYVFEDIMSSSSNDIGHTKLIWRRSELSKEVFLPMLHLL